MGSTGQRILLALPRRLCASNPPEGGNLVLLLSESKEERLQFPSLCEYLFSCTDSRLTALSNVIHLGTEVNKYFKILNQPPKELWAGRAMSTLYAGSGSFSVTFFLTTEGLEIISVSLSVS